MSNKESESESSSDEENILEETLQSASSIQAHTEQALAILERLQHNTTGSWEKEIDILHEHAMEQIRNTGTSSFGAALVALFRKN